FGSLNMIPDVTPNGVFYLPPTGWLTSFYNPPKHFYSIVFQMADKISDVFNQGRYNENGY
ncbi:hypothetical protein LMB88_12405, partial [Limosilactobacillus reuteri]|nr:hypothetical protein [Limosilactobacillus reuteri]